MTEKIRDAAGGADDKPRGTTQEFKDSKGRKYWRARITYPDKSRLYVGGRFSSKLLAKEFADEKSRDAEDRKVTVAKMAPAAKGAGKTCDDWHDDYLKFCTEQGLGTVETKRGRWRKWISPHIGTRAITSITRDDIENLRDALDEIVRAHKRDGTTKDTCSGKTVQNIWGEVTVSFGEAFNSKRRDLRVLQSDPTASVQPPERGPSKAKVYPFPSEALHVFACEKIPLEWRELHAVLAYTYVRPGELVVLDWTDVDLADQTISITKAYDYENKKTKPTKTGITRTIPIEPHLLPLLAKMHKRCGGKGLVTPLLATVNDNKSAIIMREHFALADCKRTRLTARSGTERWLVFRSWRDAGITWSVVRGDDIVKVQRRAGHKLIATTMLYAVEAENRGASYGVPLGPLPACLLESSKLASKKSGSNDGGAKNKANDESGRGDLNRRTKTHETPRIWLWNQSPRRPNRPRRPPFETARDRS
jgi:integrase